MTAAQPSDAGTARIGFSAADRFVLRMAVAATLGFAVAFILGWKFSFLVPMLAVMMVGAMPTFPRLVPGLLMPIVMWVGTTSALVLVSLLSDAPSVQLIILGLVIFLTFYAKRRGAPMIVVMLLQLGFCAVPLYSTVSLDAGHTMADFLQRSTLAAAGTLFVSHLLVPAPPLPPNPAAPKPPPISHARAARVALADTLVLFPLLVNFMLGAEVKNFVILMMTINILSDIELSSSRVMAVALMVGNTMGGLLAVAAQQIVFLADTLVFFLLTVFLATLWFAGKMARGGPKAPLFNLALGTFLLLLGLAIAPMPGGSEVTYVTRIVQIIIAGLYALAALVIVAPLRRGEPEPAPS